MSGARKLLWSGIALTALLALVAVASRAHRPGGGTGAEPAHPPTLIADYLATIALVVMPIGAILVIWGLAHRRREQVAAGRTNWRRTLVTVAILALLLAGGVGLSANLHRGRAPRVPSFPTASSVTTTSKSEQAKPRPFYRAHFRWLPVFVLGAIALGFAVTFGAAVVRRRRHREEDDEQAALAAALDEVLADTLDDLRAERDPRRAVIRAYARMEKTFAAYGAPREASEAPSEYLERALDSLRVSAFSVRRLTQLFSRAKFSTHEIDGGMKDDAIEALAGLRAELEAGREAA